METIIGKYWSNFLKKPDLWFFYAFLITSTLSIRKVLFFHPIAGSFNEYTGVYIYLSDILLILTLLFWLISTLYNNKSLLSTINIFSLLNKMFHACLPTRQVEHLLKYKSINVPRVPRRMFHVEHFFWGGTFMLFKRGYQKLTENYLTIFPLFIAIFSIISLSWSTDKTISTFRSIKLTEFVLLYFYIKNILSKNIKCSTPASRRQGEISASRGGWNIFKEKGDLNVPRGTFLKYTMLIIIGSGLVQASIGIYQAILQQSIGILWLKESIISQDIPGVAKIILNDRHYIRSYGLFPHPNILGGFLSLSIAATLLYKKLFHARLASTSGYLRESRRVEHFFRSGTFILRLILAIQIVALFLTFSKSAFFGLLIGFFYIQHAMTTNNVPRGTFLNKIISYLKLFRACPVECSTPASRRQADISASRGGWNISSGVEHFKKKTFLIIGIIFAFFLITKPNINSFVINSLKERALYLNVSRGTFLSDPILGIGAGQFVINMSNNFSLQNWQYQPVHNVFLLILNEFGILIAAGFIYFIFKLFRACPVECSTPASRRQADISASRGGWNISSGVEHFKESNGFYNRKMFSIYLKGILTSFVFIMLFDHYLWDIQQGQIMLWLLFGLIATEK